MICCVAQVSHTAPIWHPKCTCPPKSGTYQERERVVCMFACASWLVLTSACLKCGGVLSGLCASQVFHNAGAPPTPGRRARPETPRPQPRALQPGTARRIRRARTPRAPPSRGPALRALASSESGGPSSEAPGSAVWQQGWGATSGCPHASTGVPAEVGDAPRLSWSQGQVGSGQGLVWRPRKRESTKLEPDQTRLGS